jgi:transcriptional regulator with XRE-family HTH domain
LLGSTAAVPVIIEDSPPEHAAIPISIHTKRHRRLVELLVAERKARKIRQQRLARRLRRHQSWVARLESGQRRIDVVEYLELADAIGFDPVRVLRKVRAVARGPRSLACVKPLADLVNCASAKTIAEVLVTKTTADKQAEIARYLPKDWAWERLVLPGLDPSDAEEFPQL